VALNARDLTNGAQGIIGFDDSWDSVSDGIEDFFVNLGWTDVPSLFPLFLVTWVIAVLLMLTLSRVQVTPWGRVLRAVREDEDAARALGKNAFSYKLQSLAISATIACVAGFLFALNLKFVVPDEFVPVVTFIGYVVLILGGLANYWGVAVGAVILWTVLEGLRFLELPLSETRIAALRFIILGVVLIGLMAFRPQGAFGKREEMVLGE
jgi:branched-chain amino acid transport system permease protein